MKNDEMNHVLPKRQKKVASFLLDEIFPHLQKKHFFLVGGTAISLQYGHRQSIDFDFFSFPKHNHVDPVIETVDLLFRKHGIYHRRDFNPIYGQQHYLIDDVGITFMSFQNNHAEHDEELYRLPLFPTEKRYGFDTLNIKDLAGLKAFARCQRSKMKDIVDIAELLCHGISLTEIIQCTERIFGYDFSAKEFVSACLNVEDVYDNALDEEIIFLNDKNCDFYIQFLKSKVRKLYVGI